MTLGVSYFKQWIAFLEDGHKWKPIINEIFCMAVSGREAAIGMVFVSLVAVLVAL